MPLIRETYDAVQRNALDPEFRDIFHGVWSPVFQRHPVFMMALLTAGHAAPLLGTQRTKLLADSCLEKILWVFAKDERQAFFESVGRDGCAVDSAEGRLLNPGHAIESMWICMEEGRRRESEAIVRRARRIADWMYTRGLDREHGGLFSFLDADGGEPPQTAWHKETNMSWSDKVWWVHSEALYTLALCWMETGDPTWRERFLDLHAWCWERFHDSEYGEWYPELYRDGTPKLTDKGTLWKAAYHLPRSLMKIMMLFESHAGA